MIPQGFIQDLLARVDIVDVVGRHVALKKAGQNLVGLCPFHGEKTPSFTVSPAKQFFHCFGCGAHGSSVGFLMDHRGLDYVEAIRELAATVGMTVPEDPARGRDESRSDGRNARGLAEVLDAAAAHYRACLKSSPAAIDYLKARGLTGQTAARFALGWAPDDWQALKGAALDYADRRLVDAGLVIESEGRRYDRFRARVMFPIRNRRGVVIGFGGRVIGPGEPKYLNSPETPLFRKGQELYGLHEAQGAIRSRRRVIVCEGYMDVIQLAQAGFEESVAALGTAVSATHVATLFRVTDHVVFAFDGDAAGRRAAGRALEAALPLVGETRRASFALLPEGEDPDSLIARGGPAAFEEALERALPLSRWFLASLEGGEGGGLDLATAEGRAALVARARPLIESMTPGALRIQLIQELAARARMAPDAVESVFGLKRWRRLPEDAEGVDGRRGASRAGRRTAPEATDLRRRVLGWLLAHPALAREFNGPIAESFLDGQAVVERQIVEVWRCATSVSAISSGALLEVLGSSEHAAAYAALAVEGFTTGDDLEVARAELQAAFRQFELRRVTEELAARVAEPAAEGAREQIRELLLRQARLKAALVQQSTEAGGGTPSP